MKHYPSINHGIERNVPIHAFDKLDGSNIRAEWSRKRASFYKFGSRRRLIDSREPILGKSIDLIVSGFEKPLHDVFKSKGYESAVCFFEFYGPSSFAGFHQTDESYEVTLIDVAPFKKGITPPIEFVDLYGHLRIPRVLHVGLADEAFIRSVRDGTLPDMTFEGVVCKHMEPNGFTSMFKLKSSAWLKRLKDHCGDDERKFNELK